MTNDKHVRNNQSVPSIQDFRIYPQAQTATNVIFGLTNPHSLLPLLDATHC